MGTSISMVSPSENSGDFLFFFEWVIFFVSGKVPALGAVTMCKNYFHLWLLAIISLSSYEWALIANISLVGNHK